MKVKSNRSEVPVSNFRFAEHLRCHPNKTSTYAAWIRDIVDALQ